MVSEKEATMIELNADNLADVVKENETVVVQYGAAWCGSCRMIKPKFKKLADATENVSFVYVDAEKFPASRGLAQVSNLPTFALFKNGELVNQNQGSKIELVEELLK